MQKLKNFFGSHHIQISLAVGVGILTLAWFSKKVLPEPLSYLENAFPPFWAVIYEALYPRYKDKRICTTWYWVAAILLSTLIIILIHM